ncbi:hypothetical protein RhiirA5_370056 [Rhizophagus irregularis]|uniref:Uncharacterized protein n=1 Tax=Rhizophagus irregularis TaxID=588596 RepID=A0A2N0RU15_9GLOM|nr:hypothetical protein RhiirA5_370056 [Rhizophagus irregularis]PKC66807.1 hypothetical protein RhiirA1_394196 [Rhizophagus irregularis]CAB4485244.1 unnamed protein product [Rhizophagus irregularis]CAB5197471.1 unnamed protein product [Rhizophagus irregularis]
MVYWTDLDITCPVKDCPDSKSGLWTHRYCGGIMEISSELYIRCKKSDCNNSYYWNNWKFSCQEHPLSYDSPDAATLFAAVGVAQALARSKGDNNASQAFKKAAIRLLELHM